MSWITGIARSTTGRGLAELRGTSPPEAGRGQVRRRGAGRPALIDSDPTLLGDLVDLVEPSTRGDPMAPLKWTAKSVRKLAAERTIPRLRRRIGRFARNLTAREAVNCFRHAGYA